MEGPAQFWCPEAKLLNPVIVRFLSVKPSRKQPNETDCAECFCSVCLRLVGCCRTRLGLSLITQRSVVQIRPTATQGIIADLKRPPHGPVGELPPHCRITQTCCNANQTLLQLNSNNYTVCEFGRYFAVAVFRGEWRFFAVFGDFYRVQMRRNST